METTNRIHSTAIIDDSVTLGTNNIIGPYTIITGDVTIGDNNIIESHVVIGRPPEHRDSWADGQYKGVRIGNGNRINAFTTIDSGYEEYTFIHDGCYLLRGCHVGHDAIVSNNGRLHCNIVVGGHAVLQDRVYLGLGSVVNPKLTIGANSLIGS